MEKSKQQKVFEWLLENQQVLYGPNNTLLYKEFESSELPRNRLRSYKSRLKEKLKKGEIPGDVKKESQTTSEDTLNIDISKKIAQINWSKVLKILLIVSAIFFIPKIIRKIFK